MANSKEAQFKRDIIKVETLHGWQVRAASGCDLKLRVSQRIRTASPQPHQARGQAPLLEEAEGDYSIIPVTEEGSGKPHDSDKKRLAEIIDRLNDLYGAEVSTTSCTSPTALWLTY